MAVFPCNQAACYGKRAVHPSAHDHAAIAFHIQTDIRAVLDFRIFLDLERRGIAVSCDDAEELSAIFRHGKATSALPSLVTTYFRPFQSAMYLLRAAQ